MYSDLILEIILLLRGYYIKLGQLGSLRSDFLPSQWVSRLETLHSDVPSLPIEHVQKLVIAALGDNETSLKQSNFPFDGSIGSIFPSIDAVPLGAASIGQVHSAKLFTGQDVVLKIQYPEVERTFRADMATVKLFCSLAQPEFLSFLDEIEKQFMTEFDYQKEAKNLEIAAQNLTRSVHASTVVIPKPFLPLCSKRLLVMEKLNGLNMTQTLRKNIAEVAAYHNLTTEEFMALYRDAPPPSSSMIGLQSALTWAYDMTNNLTSLVYNSTTAWVTGSTKEYISSPRLIDLRWIVDTLFSIHAEQIFRFGFFNGDPHPGNIMMLEDGRIGLIDFGQVKSLNDKQRAILARLYIALEEKDAETVGACFTAMGNVTKIGSVDTMVTYSRLNFDYDDDETRNGLNVQAFFEELGRVDPLLVAAQEWVMPSRVSIMLRGFATGVRYPVRTTKYFTPVARKFLEENPEMSKFVQTSIDTVKQYNNHIQMLRETGNFSEEVLREKRKTEIPQLVSYAD